MIVQNHFLFCKGWFCIVFIEKELVTVHVSEQL